MTTATAEVTNWIGLGLTSLGMILGGMAYVQNKLEKLRDQFDTRLENLKKELSDQHKTDLARVDKAMDDEKLERRRELGAMADQLKGFADVASATMAMGKSIEHLAERFNDHQRNTEKSLEEIKQEVRSARSPRSTTSRRTAAKGG